MIGGSLSINWWRVLGSQQLFKQGQSHQLSQSLFTGSLRSSSHTWVSTLLPHPSEFRSVFFERNNHDQTPFLGFGCRDIFGQGARSPESECITIKSATGYSSANDILLWAGQKINFRILRSENVAVFLVSQQRVSKAFITDLLDIMNCINFVKNVLVQCHLSLVEKTNHFSSSCNVFTQGLFSILYAFLPSGQECKICSPFSLKLASWHVSVYNKG